MTRNRLLTLLAILCAAEVILLTICLNGEAFSIEVKVIITFAFLSPPFLFVKIKLFIIARRMCKNNTVSPKVTTMVKLKNVSSCLMAVACFVSLTLIPSGIFVVFSFVEEPSSVNTVLSGLWAGTVLSMNSTLNCLIFYWKNKILQTEGLKVLKLLKP